MKILFSYIGALLAITGTEMFLLTAAENPEALLVGKWREVLWEYESPELAAKDLGQEVNDRVGKTLVIHKAEYWEFLPNQTFILHNKQGKVVGKWRLTGRANVLLLQYDLNVVEHYNVSRLSPEMLWLNFDADIQAKGIAKLIFRRAEES